MGYNKFSYFFQSAVAVGEASRRDIERQTWHQAAQHVPAKSDPGASSYCYNMKPKGSQNLPPLHPTRSILLSCYCSRMDMLANLPAHLLASVVFYGISRIRKS